MEFCQMMLNKYEKRSEGRINHICRASANKTIIYSDEWEELRGNMEKIVISCKCAMLGRKPKQAEKDRFKTALISFFDENNPHKKGLAPKKVLEFPDMEKIRIRNLSTSYYLEGNDLVINDLKQVELEVDNKKRKIMLRAVQEQVEQRN